MYKKKIGLILFILFALCLAVVACSPKEPSQNNSEQVNVEQEGANQMNDFVWSDDTDCAICHERNDTSFADSSCIASEHGELQEDCMICHDDAPGLIDAHAGVTYETEKKKETLRKTKVTDAQCLSCHDKEELAAITDANTVLTDKEGMVVNPHMVPESESHERVVCSSCHIFHRDSAMDETAQAVCRNCHHADIYTCGTCHL